MRARVRRLWIASCAVLTCLGSFSIACLTANSTDRSDPLARLQSLGDAWLRTPVTVTYSTVQHSAGGATSIHQCLRQMAGGVIDRQAAIRMCNGEGELTLTWDPPDRWRMVVSNARGVSTLLSTPQGAYHCHRPPVDARRCAPTSPSELASEAPFRAILLRPSQILDELGPRGADMLIMGPEREIAGFGAECFSAALVGPDGEAKRADWCYSKDGVLLQSLVVLPDEATTMLEATEVSRDVSETDLDVETPQIDANATDIAPIAGTWEFDALTGVPPAELPPGSVPDNRHDLVIDDDGSFRWGTWVGHVSGSNKEFALLVVRPAGLRQRFDEYRASVGISIVGRAMQIWLPDLGQDRDVDFGAAVEDIDSADMAFRRVDGQPPLARRQAFRHLRHGVEKPRGADR